MPLKVLAGGLPSPPAWGTLPLDFYLLSEWDTPHPDPCHPPESPADRRKRLIRQFLALGVMGRGPYGAQLESPPTPTEAQIEEILRPARLEALRPFADYSGSWGEGLYLRTCYDEDKEEQHQALWEDNLNSCYVNDEGIIFDDKDIFREEGMDVARFLELFPERVTNDGSADQLELRDAVLQEQLDVIAETEADLADNPDELSAFRERATGPDSVLRYAYYHAACVVTHLFVEDEVALTGGGLLHVFLDDCGNVVRQWRVSGYDCDFDGTWEAGNWKDYFEAGYGELGAAYQAGGPRGPPYRREGQ